ncbi:putative effector of murein hydrolase LrgA (UPF0299 family) [Paenibacillus sp. JGP012]|nr:putative effector of murein hydrolase LrgA (UPF0299 family) [Paenibacillus sp. JGP012]
MKKFRILDYVIVFFITLIIGVVNIVKTDDYFSVIAQLLMYVVIFSLVVGTVTNLLFRSWTKRNKS